MQRKHLDRRDTNQVDTTALTLQEDVHVPGEPGSVTKLRLLVAIEAQLLRLDLLKEKARSLLNNTRCDEKRAA